VKLARRLAFGAVATVLFFALAEGLLALVGALALRAPESRPDSEPRGSARALPVYWRAHGGI
jgi:hypothetical protein